MKIEKSIRLLAMMVPVVLGGCAGLSGNSVGQAGPSAYERGKFHYAAGQYGLAVKKFRTAVDRDPQSIEALNGLAATYDRLGRFDLSARYYGRALAADPDSPQTLNNIGYSYLLQERFDLAVAYLRDAYRRDQDDPFVIANRRAAEVGYQEADLKRSVQPEAEPAQVAKAPVRRARTERVTSWIERTAPAIQSLVTKPQLVFLETAEDAGVNPQLAAFRPMESEAEGLLLDPLAAPMGLRADDVKADFLAGESVRPDKTPALAATKVAALAAERLAPLPGNDAPPVPKAEDTASLLRPEQGMREPVSPLSPEQTADKQVALLRPDRASGQAATPIEAEGPVGPPIPLLQPARPAETQVALVQPEQKIEDVVHTHEAERPMTPLRLQGAPHIEVSNGTGRLSMAARIRNFLIGGGVTVQRLTNADHYSYMETTIFYRNGWRIYAEELARILPAAVDLTANDDQRADIRVELGGDLLDFDRDLYYADRRSTHERKG